MYCNFAVNSKLEYTCYGLLVGLINAKELFEKLAKFNKFACDLFLIWINLGKLFYKIMLFLFML